MRVVFVPIPGIGHAFPMVPLAWALMAAGHEVTFLAGQDAIEIRNAGVPVIDPVPGTSMEEMLPSVMADMPAVFRPMEHLTVEEILALKPLIVKPWDHFADAYVAAAERVRPDLVVYDPVFNAGPVAASVLGVPALGHGFMLVRFGAELLREHAPGAFERHGVGLPKKLAQVEIGPSSLMEAGRSTWQMRYVPYNGGGVLPEWLGESSGRPRIAVTLGTVSPRTTGNERFERVIAAAREVDADFMLTVGESTAASLGELPENVHVTGWVPLFQLLQTCTAIIHHGGSGTMFTSSAAGLPQLVIPQGADNDYNARALREYGCALVPPGGAVDAEAITALMTDVELRIAAQGLRHEIERMPTPADLVPAIVDFAHS
ncbi:nucleotide disphospho-sugar-binding domain-containing protein [Micromonospora chersina]|uniref:nucleotide disphospho-sugar-binding domain-containing protein n=1 Tax=Micromonospora chersina TaxID=47854 RepID=UPI0033C3F546